MGSLSIVKEAASAIALLLGASISIMLLKAACHERQLQGLERKAK